MTHPDAEHTTRSLDSGVVVHRWRPSQPRRAVVLQHGYGEYAERYLTEHHRLIDHLIGAGFEVWALDLWGHGRSPGPRGVCHVGRAVDDHRQVLHLAAATGLPVSAIGHSLGGLVTAASAAEYDGDLAAVVLLSPALPGPMPRAGRRLLGLAARLAPAARIPQRRRPLAEVTQDTEVIRRTAADPRMHHRQIGFLLATTALDAMKLLRAQPPRSTPYLILHGTADTYTDPAGSRDLAAHLGRSAHLHLIEGAHHELLSDIGCEDVLQRALTFME